MENRIIGCLLLCVTAMSLAGCSLKNPRETSFDEGVSFNENKVLFDSTVIINEGFTYVNPLLLKDEANTLFVVWLSLGKQRELMLARSYDDGKSWETQAVPSGGIFLPLCLTSGLDGNLYLMQASQAPVAEINFCKSSDKGKTWTGPILISNEKSNLIYQDSTMHIDEQGNMIVIYKREKEIGKNTHWIWYLQHSLDKGSTWDEGIVPDGIFSNGFVFHPILLQSDNILYLFGRGSVFRSFDKGQSWQKVLNIVNSSIAHSIPKGNIYVAYPNVVKTKKPGLEGLFVGGEIEGFVDIYFSKFDDQNRISANPVRVNDVELEFESIAPSFFGRKIQRLDSTRIAVILDLNVSENGKIIGALWKDFREGKANIYFSYSLDEGQTWSKSVKVNDIFSPGDLTLLTSGNLMIRDDGTITILWTAMTKLTGTNIGNKEALYSRTGMISY